MTTTVLSESRIDLRALFEPKSIALIGATDKSPWSLNTFQNIQASGFEGRVHLVNPRTEIVHGEKTYPDIPSLPEVVDLVFVMVPTGAVLDTLKSAVAAGTKAAVVLTSGFGEVGEEGKRLEQELVDFARESGLILLGPNGNGFINAVDRITPYGLPIGRPLLDGEVGFVLQSGALASSVLSFAQTRNVGISFLTAMGNEAVLSVTDVMEYLIDSPNTKVIALFLEVVRDTAEFRRIARKALRAGKPIVALKVGRSELGAQAALAHTGALVGDNGVNESAFAQLGISRVTSLEELIITAGLFASTGSLPGRRMGVVTPSGGASEIIADRAEDEGVSLPEFAPETVAALTEIVPDFATVQNPLDVTGYVVIDRTLTRRAVAAVAEDPGVDFVLLNSDLPKVEGADHASSVEAFRATAEMIKGLDLPVLVMGTALSDITEYGRRLQRESGFPYVLGGIDRGLQAIGHVLAWSERYQDAIASETDAVGRDAEIIVPADAEGMWTEYRAGQFLTEHGVSVVPSLLAATADDAVAHAEQLGYPVVVKAVADGLGHKSEVGGVRLNLTSAEEVRAAHDGIVETLLGLGVTGAKSVVQPQRVANGVEMIVGIVRDPSWGLTLAVGLGGIWVEVLKDAALRVLPVSESDIKKAITELRAFVLLKGARGQESVDIDALAHEVAKIAEVAHRMGDRLEALEINPLRASAHGAEALDALVTWSEINTEEEAGS